MAEITLNNITFSNIDVEQSVVSNGGKNTRASFVTNNKFDTTKLQNVTNAVASGKTQWSKNSFINAVEIDWNGAKLDNVELAVLDNKNTINTTGQLLALINDLQEQINAIVYIMNGGNTGGDNSGNGTSPVQSPTPTPTPTPSTPTPSTTSPITTTP